MTENAADKAKRLLGEGRLTVRRITPRLVYGQVRGDSGEEYDVGYDAVKNEWRCNCPARGRCSHIRALQLVTVVTQLKGGNADGNTD